MTEKIDAAESFQMKSAGQVSVKRNVDGLAIEATKVDGLSIDLHNIVFEASYSTPEKFVVDP